ncbi:NUDIX domain-containing protein [Micromonospora sp. HUAS YX12]|uniref:NUDIX domain-containing protein n=1 Tax=Micromonospora sp. HUAS YX12 TaxID=3156396 RepID=A0AAU7R6M8_9ACTN
MRPLAVSIVGSFRQYYPEVLEAAAIFSEAGITVASPAVSTIVNPGAEFVRFRGDNPESADHEIQSDTMQKILSSDFVYVVAPNGYIGRTTSYELGSIRDRDIPVYFSAPPRDLPVPVPAEAVVSAGQLARRIREGALLHRRPRLVTQMTADLVVLTVREERLHVLLVTRATDPFKGQLALPGGFMRAGEALEDAAWRELGEETGFDAAKLPFEQLGTYSDPTRDPRPRRVISTAFLAIAPNLPVPAAATDARRADWVEVESSLVGRLAFDHGRILLDGLERARTLLEHTTIAADFCGPTFTLRELCQVYEAVWGSQVDMSNFRRKVLALALH